MAIGPGDLIYDRRLYTSVARYRDYRGVVATDYWTLTVTLLVLGKACHNLFSDRHYALSSGSGDAPGQLMRFLCIEEPGDVIFNAVAYTGTLCCIL